MITGAYAAWADWLRAFGRGEVHELDGLPAMLGEEQGGHASTLLAQRCADAFDARLELWIKRLQRDLRHARSETEMARALVAARSALAPVRRFTETPLLMEETRTALANALREVITDLQSELETQAQRAGYRERESTLRVLRGTPLTRALEGDCAPPVEAPQLTAFDPLAPAGRRQIIFTPGADANG